jgi:hypothetical protein
MSSFAKNLARFDEELATTRIIATIVLSDKMGRSIIGKSPLFISCAKKKKGPRWLIFRIFPSFLWMSQCAAPQRGRYLRPIYYQVRWNFPGSVNISYCAQLDQKSYFARDWKINWVLPLLVEVVSNFSNTQCSCFPPVVTPPLYSGRRRPAWSRLIFSRRALSILFLITPLSPSASYIEKKNFWCCAIAKSAAPLPSEVRVFLLRH